MEWPELQADVECVFEGTIVIKIVNDSKCITPSDPVVFRGCREIGKDVAALCNTSAVQCP